MFFTKSYKEAQESNNKNNKKSFEALPEGFYELVAESAEVTTTKSGVPMTKVKFNVRKDANKSYGNRKLFNNFVHSVNGEYYTLRFMMAINTPESHLEFIKNQQDFANYIIGKPVRAKIKVVPHWKNPNELTNEIDYFEKSEAPFIQPQEEEQPSTNANEPFTVTDDMLPF